VEDSFGWGTNSTSIFACQSSSSLEGTGAFSTIGADDSTREGEKSMNLLREKSNAGGGYPFVC
jgi:hypothetical protein